MAAKKVAQKKVKTSAWGKMLDKKKKAKKPGRRVSEVTGNAYSEKRSNRSDVSKKTRL